MRAYGLSNPVAACRPNPRAERREAFFAEHAETIIELAELVSDGS